MQIEISFVQIKSAKDSYLNPFHPIIYMVATSLDIAVCNLLSNWWCQQHCDFTWPTSCRSAACRVHWIWSLVWRYNYENCNYFKLLQFNLCNFHCWVLSLAFECFVIYIVEFVQRNDYKFYTLLLIVYLVAKHSLLGTRNFHGCANKIPVTRKPARLAAGHAWRSSKLGVRVCRCVKQKGKCLGR